MKRDDFIGASISTRIYEDDLVKDFYRLNELDSLSEIMNVLSDSSYGRYIQELRRPEEYEEILSKELVRVYDKIEDITPDKNLTDYLREKYNFHNLKVLVKEIIQDEDYKYSPMGNIDVDYLKRQILKTDEKDIFEEDEENIYLTYLKRAIDAYEDRKDPAMIDISLDKSYYERELDIANATGMDSLINYTKEAIDLINVKTLLRVRNLDQLGDCLIDGGFIDKDRFLEMYKLDMTGLLIKMSNDKIYPYLAKALDNDKGEVENLLNLEKAIDDHFMDFAKASKAVTYGPEVLLAYLISKEQEIKNLRIIFISKLNGLSKEFTKDRLREAYV